MSFVNLDANLISFWNLILKIQQYPSPCYCHCFYISKMRAGLKTLQPTRSGTMNHPPTITAGLQTSSQSRVALWVNPSPIPPETSAAERGRPLLPLIKTSHASWATIPIYPTGPAGKWVSPHLKAVPYDRCVKQCHTKLWCFTASVIQV